MADQPAHAPASFLDCNSTVIRRASRHLSRLYDREFAGVGLRTTQFVILALLAEGSGNSIPALADRLSMDRSSLGHNLRPLEKAGLVALMPDPSDRRRRTIALTAEGRARLTSANAIWHHAQAKFLAEFGADDAERMRAMMTRVTALKFE